jgi:hypothetical protein
MKEESATRNRNSGRKPGNVRSAPSSQFSPRLQPGRGEPSPWSCGMSRLRGKSRKIFDVKELIGKIFRTEDLASAATVPRGHAQRVSFAY